MGESGAGRAWVATSVPSRACAPRPATPPPPPHAPLPLPHPPTPRHPSPTPPPPRPTPSRTDATGAEIERALLAAARANPAINLFEHHLGVDLVLGEGERGANYCLGADCLDQRAGAVTR